MSNYLGAEGHRRFYQNISGSTSIAAADGDATLVTVKDIYHTIFIQKIIVFITTDAAQSWSFEDTAGTPKEVAAIAASPGDNTRWEFDYGDRGVPLTEGKNFVLDVSAAGLAGNIEWLGYSKLTAVTAADNL